MSMHTLLCSLIACCALLTCSRVFSNEVESRQGDWTVQGDEVVLGKHIRLDGSLILPPNSKLTLQDCTLEIIGDYSRHHGVEWQGGTLITKNCSIGGFVDQNGTSIHTVFHLYEGLWEATDTTVSYSYGISFHWEKGNGVLRGTRLKAGPRPDAIILSGEADVELVDSDFPIGLGVYCHEGGSTELSLMPSDSVTAIYDRATLLPGVDWRLSLKNTRVERWFLFLRRIGGWQPPANVTLGESKDVIVSLFTHNLQGTVHLTNELEEPLEIGNLTLQRSGDHPSGINMFAMYLSGEETDATIRGRTHICEWMQSGGKVSVRGIADRNDLSFGCTTLELSNDAELDAENVHFGRPLAWQPENNVAEANVKDDAVLIAKRISTNKIRFRTEGKGRIFVQDHESHGTLEKKQSGGEILIGSDRVNVDRNAAKPKTWIYTDMSDPTLQGMNKEGTINDPDDVSAMAGYLLMANEFETLGIVVASTHRQEHRTTPNQADWANRFFGNAYQTDLPQLNKQIGGYPSEVVFLQSCIKPTSERFAETKSYRSLDAYPTVRALLEHAQSINDGDLINVLCWGSLTEPAILVKHCTETGRPDLLKQLRFIAHWTNSPLHQGTQEHPERVANCQEDAAACAYLKRLASLGKLTYHECGAIGQHGIVSGSPKGMAFYDQFRTSQLGSIFVEGKFAYNSVDHSDSATYWTLLDRWGVELDQIPADGSNNAFIESKHENAFKQYSSRIHAELLRRSRIAGENRQQRD